MTPTEMITQHGGNAGLSTPWLHAFAITPATTTFTNASRGIFVGTGGNVNLVTAGGETVLFTNVPNGTLLPVVTKGVLATSTTASDIVGGY